MKKFNVSFLHLLEIAMLSILLAVAGCSMNEVNETDLNSGPSDYTETTPKVANIDLGTAGNYVILAKTGVSTTGTTAIGGDIGLSPADHTYFTGFSEILDGTGQFSTSIYVVGKLYAADYAVPTPATLDSAISDMETAYTAAAGLTTPDYTDVGSAGEIGGLTLAPGLYKWTTGVSVTTDVTISGSDTDVWVFQIAGNLTVANGASVMLAGGALPENIVWQVGSSASFGTSSHTEGIILTSTEITMNTGAVLNGRLLSQSAVTMEADTIMEPGAVAGISE